MHLPESLYFCPVPPLPERLLSTSGYKVLEPIRHGNLTVFPVVAARSHDTQEFLTLDEGCARAK